jgi:iron complex outermembrane receptor protein
MSDSSGTPYATRGRAPSGPQHALRAKKEREAGQVRKAQWFARGAAVALAAGVMAPAMTSPAQAQAARTQTARARTDSPVLGEVVVTARRMEERLQDVPISISVLNQRELKNQNISYATDLANYVPSLQSNPEFGNNNSTFALRGFQQDPGTSPTVGVYFADVVAPRAGFGGNVEHAGEGAGPGDFFDLENVQVLKGPQGTLFGRNTTGGAILLVPHKPTDKFEGYAELSGGNYKMERVQVVLNVPITDKVRTRFGLEQQGRDGYLVNISGVGPDRFNNINYLAARFSIDADITDKLNTYTIFTYTHADENGGQQQLFACDASGGGIALFTAPFLCTPQLKQIQASSEPYAMGNNLDGARSFLRELRLINTTTYKVSEDLTIKNIASYSHIENLDSTGLFGDSFRLPSFFGPYAGALLPAVQSAALPNVYMSDQKNYTEELQAQGHAVDGKLDWQAGIYIEGSEPAGRQGYITPSLITCTNDLALQCTDVLGPLFDPTGNLRIGSVNIRFGQISYRNYAAYGQATYAFSPKWKLTAGFRYTKDITSGSSTRVHYTFPAPNTPVASCEVPGALVLADCFHAARTSSTAPTGLINLQYLPVPDVMTYVQYARGYRQGGLYLIGAPEFETFQPEHVDAYEIGLKSTFHYPISGLFNAAVFYDKFNNQQLEVSNFSSTQSAPVTASIINAGESRIFGVEATLALYPVDGLTFSIDYSYLDSLLQSVTVPTPAPGSPYDIIETHSVPGTPLPLSPRNKVVVSETYQLPVDPGLGKISVGSTFSHTSKQLIMVGGNFPYIPGYSLLNFNVNWESMYNKPVDLEFFMTNALNNFYASYVLDLAVPGGLGFASRNLGEPRMFGGRLRYHF